MTGGALFTGDDLGPVTHAEGDDQAALAYLARVGAMDVADMLGLGAS